MTREEQHIVAILEDLDRWVSTLTPGSAFHRDYSHGLSVDAVARSARLHRRAARRALERLIAGGHVTRTETHAGVRYRPTGREAGIVAAEQRR